MYNNLESGKLEERDSMTTKQKYVSLSKKMTYKAYAQTLKTAIQALSKNSYMSLVAGVRPAGG